MWLSLVEHLVWDQGVACSNRVTPTIIDKPVFEDKNEQVCLFLCLKTSFGVENQRKKPFSIKNQSYKRNNICVYIAGLVLKIIILMLKLKMKGKIIMRIPYGYAYNETGKIVVDNNQAGVAKKIYTLYLKGQSLGGIVNVLKAENILSPTGNATWTRAAIDKVLNNGRYFPNIISEEQFWKAQIEREHRTNINDNGRKTARYNSQNVLSGLLVCGECGCNYRRITRPSGEVVWRCADKVENGKRAVCSNKVTVSDEEIKKIICKQLDMGGFDEEVVNDMLDTVIINEEGIAIQMKSLQSIAFH